MDDNSHVNLQYSSGALRKVFPELAEAFGDRLALVEISSFFACDWFLEIFYKSTKDHLKDPQNRILLLHGECILWPVLSMFRDLMEEYPDLITGPDQIMYAACSAVDDVQERIDKLRGFVGLDYNIIGLSREHALFNTESHFDIAPTKVRRKKFLTFNRRTRWIRIRLIAELIDRGIIDEGYASFLFNQNFLNELKKEPSEEFISYWQDTVLPLASVLESNMHMFPMEVDMPNMADNNIFQLNPESAEFYRDSYFNITCETQFYSGKEGDPFIKWDKLYYWGNNLSEGTHRYSTKNDIFFTEKTWKSIQTGQPLILIGQRRMLEQLRRYGYETFGRWFDESYDTELDDEKRFKIIIEEIDRLTRLSHKEWVMMYNDMVDTLRHNQAHFYRPRSYWTDNHEVKKRILALAK